MSEFCLTLLHLSTTQHKNLRPPTEFSYITREKIYVFGPKRLKEVWSRETETPVTETVKERDCQGVCISVCVCSQYVYVHFCIAVFICLCSCVSMHIHLSVWVYIYVCVCVCECAWTTFILTKKKIKSKAKPAVNYLKSQTVFNNWGLEWWCTLTKKEKKRWRQCRPPTLP